MPAKSKRSVCPLACALDLLGDRWTMLILRDLFVGRSQFGEFIKSPERIASNTLADRLARLVAARLVETFRNEDRPGTDGYRLTPKGASTRPILDAIMTWGLANIRGTEARMQPKSDLQKPVIPRRRGGAP
jgi:DNA-binding HxlR family transcriptional regulator